MERRGKKGSGVKLSYLTHIISSGQFTFLHTFYDPISFVVFHLFNCCLTHCKTEAAHNAQAQKPIQVPSCPVNHMWYTVFKHFWPHLQHSPLIGYIPGFKNSSSMVPNKGKRCLRTKSNLCILFRVCEIWTSRRKTSKFRFRRPLGLLFFPWECSQTLLFETRGSQTDKCLDKISIIGTFIRSLLIKCFVVEKSTV